MMKLFKKKKSDNKLSTTMLQQENPLGSSLTIVPSTSSSSIKKPAPAKATNEPMIRSYTPPTLVMPKPRRVLTPTRAILAGYDNDKTQVEDEEEEQETGSMVQDYISPILLPTSHHGDSSLYKNTVNKIATMKQVSSSTAGSDDTSSRVYESALESLPDEQPEIDDVVEGDAESEQWLPSPELSNLNNFANLVVQSPHVPSVPDFKKRVPVKSSNASSATVIPPHLNKQPTPSASVSQTLLKQKEEQDILLQQLKQQVELMEKQRILDREEWSKKEQELLNHRQQMMETLIETKDQLTNVLKAREENKAREAYYQKQLQQQQLLQLQQQQQQQQQQQLQQQQLMQQQLQQQQHSLSNEEEEDADEEEVQVNPSQQQAHEYYQQQQHMASDEYGEERRANKMRPDEYARSYHSRSSSRASNHPSIYQQAPQEEGRKSAISRRNSNASNKSGKSGILNRCDPSPSATLVAPTPQQRGYSRRRAKSIESGKWHDDGMGPPVYEASQLYYHDNRPRRSRSVGRRPSSVVYNDYYDDDDVEDDGYDYYDASPRYSGKHAYHNDYYVQQQPIYTTSDLYPGDYYSPRHPFPPLQPQQMQYHPPPPPSSRQINAQRYVAQPRHYHYN